MTVRRKTEDDEGQFNITVSKKLIFGVLALIASGTPPGQAFLYFCGLKTPAIQEVTEVQKTADSIRTDISAVKSDVAALKSDVSSVKMQVADVKLQVADASSKTQILQNQFTGFQVDFNRFKEAKPQ